MKYPSLENSTMIRMEKTDVPVLREIKKKENLKSDSKTIKHLLAHHSAHASDSAEEQTHA